MKYDAIMVPDARRRFATGLAAAVLTTGLGLACAGGTAFAADHVPNKVHGVSTTKWSAKKAPNYVKKAGRAVVKAKPAKGKIKYKALDSKGRTQQVKGTITYRLVKKSAGWRESFASDANPSGWGHNKVVKIKLPTGRTYRGYLYNRSHLIADSLGGHAVRANLVTGTRMQNVGANNGNGGMAYCETRAVKWLYRHHKGSIYYAATPKYVGNELIPRSVVVDMKSSDGTLNGRYVVYNAANGYKINYRTGTWKKTKATAYRKHKKSSTKNTAHKKYAKKHTKKAKAHKKAAAKHSRMVYTTATGARYHSTKHCRGLSRARHIYRESIKAAKAQGLTKCHLCW